MLAAAVRCPPAEAGRRGDVDGASGVERREHPWQHRARTRLIERLKELPVNASGHGVGETERLANLQDLRDWQVRGVPARYGTVLLEVVAVRAEAHDELLAPASDRVDARPLAGPERLDPTGRGSELLDEERADGAVIRGHGL